VIGEACTKDDRRTERGGHSGARPRRTSPTNRAATSKANVHVLGRDIAAIVDAIGGVRVP
jgi:hypothetical protein